MDADDLEPANRPVRPANLEAMSIEALVEYIADLEAEIARARSTVEAKKAARSAADSVFGG